MAESTPKRRLPELKPVERRTFLRYSLIGSVSAGLGGFSLASLGFLWPRVGEGFGVEIAIGPAADLLAQIEAERAPLHFPQGRLYVIKWEPNVPGAQAAYGDHHVQLSDDVGLMALFHTCVHLGCMVPWCQTSQWFECPCHGSKYNRWGEWVGGPASRGLDRFPSRIDDDGNFLADTGTLLTGPGRTARVLQQQAEGPACIDI